MKSKIMLLSAILCVVSLRSSVAQIVIENVSFNNYISPTDNDFANRFTGGLGLAQITTNGITGGCLTTPNTVNWGNDNAIYCSKYIASLSYYSITRISFKYDSTQINSTNFDRAVSIFLRPNADFNHYVIASVNYDKRLQILTYSWANSPPLLVLHHYHWYEIILTTNFVTGSPTYQININAQVNDLGLTGLTPPIPTGNSSGTIYDNILFGDSAVQVSFTGAAWGGAKYLENFHFEGIKSADSCLTFPTGIADDEFNPDIILFPNPAKNKLAIGIPNHREQAANSIEVYDIVGKKLLCAPLSFRRGVGGEVIDVSTLTPGIYFIRIANNKIIRTKKFIVLK